MRRIVVFTTVILLTGIGICNEIEKHEELGDNECVRW